MSADDRLKIQNDRYEYDQRNYRKVNDIYVYITLYIDYYGFKIPLRDIILPPC